MPCEHYKNALVETVASGATPQGELRAHLNECASCRAIFDEEHSLFAAIDFGLHVAVNEEVPTSLIPRVRAGLDKAAGVHPHWNSVWFALTAVATVAALLLVTIRVHHNNLDGLPTNLAANLPAAPEAVPTQTPSLPSPREGRLPLASLMPVAKGAKLLKESASHSPSPEILVPNDQEVLLASYAQQWNSRARAPLANANEVVEATVEPLQVSPIQIAHLDVKPLAEEGSR